MKITKVNYQKSFVIGPYLQERIGFEIEIDGTTESESAALTKAKEIAEVWHKANNPQLEGVIIQDAPDQGPPPTEIQVKKEAEEDRIRILIQDMEKETVLRRPDGTGGLLSWKYLAEKHPVMFDSYNKKLKELENV